jgi:hypothetical protein
MDDCVCRAAARQKHAQCILKCLPRHDIARTNTLDHQLDSTAAGLLGQSKPPGVGCPYGRGAWKHHAEDLGEDGHG